MKTSGYQAIFALAILAGSPVFASEPGEPALGPDLGQALEQNSVQTPSFCLSPVFKREMEKTPSAAERFEAASDSTVLNKRLTDQVLIQKAGELAQNYAKDPFKDNGKTVYETYESKLYELFLNQAEQQKGGGFSAENGYRFLGFERFRSYILAKTKKGAKTIISLSQDIRFLDDFRDIENRAVLTQNPEDLSRLDTEINDLVEKAHSECQKAPEGMKVPGLGISFDEWFNASLSPGKKNEDVGPRLAESFDASNGSQRQTASAGEPKAFAVAQAQETRLVETAVSAVSPSYHQLPLQRAMPILWADTPMAPEAGRMSPFDKLRVNKFIPKWLEKSFMYVRKKVQGWVRPSAIKRRVAWVMEQIKKVERDIPLKGIIEETYAKLRQAGFNPSLFLASLIFRESSANPKAVSDKNAVGLMQMTEGATTDVLKKYSSLGVTADRTDPVNNIKLGLLYTYEGLKEGTKEFKNDAEAAFYALARHNGGAGLAQRTMKWTLKNEGETSHAMMRSQWVRSFFQGLFAWYDVLDEEQDRTIKAASAAMPVLSM